MKYTDNLNSKREYQHQQRNSQYESNNNTTNNNYKILVKSKSKEITTDKLSAISNFDNSSSFILNGTQHSGPAG